MNTIRVVTKDELDARHRQALHVWLYTSVFGVAALFDGAYIFGNGPLTVIGVLLTFLGVTGLAQLVLHR